MRLKTYRNPARSDGSYSADEIERGLHWVTTDVECPWCGKNQPVMATHYLSGPCVRCGGLTSGVSECSDAAPDLLAVCRALVNDFDNCNGKTDTAIVRAAREAIAKAETPFQVPDIGGPDEHF